MASSSHIKPKEKGSITARLDTANRKGMTVKTIALVSNDPTRSKITLTLRAFIKEFLQPLK